MSVSDVRKLGNCRSGGYHSGSVPRAAVMQTLPRCTSHAFCDHGTGRVTQTTRCISVCSEKDGYTRAPFLEPLLATVLTAVLVAVLGASGLVQTLADKANASTESNTPYTDVKTISFGVVNGCAHAHLALKLP
jgi:hypothetical protein